MLMLAGVESRQKCKRLQI